MRPEKISEEQATQMLASVREAQLASTNVRSGKAEKAPMLQNRFWRAVVTTWLFGRILISYISFGLFVRPFLSEERRREKLDAIHALNAGRLYADFIRLKGVYIKIGQFLSTQAAIIPPAYLAEMAKMQDQMPEATVEEIRERILQEFGEPAEKVFAEFDPEPLACASIGQVHRVKLHDGRDSVVKVKYPGIDDYFHADLKVIRALVPIAIKLIELTLYREESGVNHNEILHEFIDHIRMELDYRRERSNHLRMYEQLSGLRAKNQVIVPELYEEYCRDAVICMEFIQGNRIMPWYMNKRVAGHKKDWLFKCLVECLFYTISYHGFFQADTHPGNFMVHDADPENPDSQATLVMLDFGCSKDFPPGFRAGVVQVINGYLTKKHELIVDALWDQGFRTKLHTKDSLAKWVEQGVRLTDETMSFFREGTDVIEILREKLVTEQEVFFKLFMQHRIAAVPQHYAMLLRVLVTAPVPLEAHMPKVDFMPMAMSYMSVLATKARTEEAEAKAAAKPAQA